MLPPLPRKNKKSSSASFWGGSGDDDASSISSLSTSGGTAVVDDDRAASRSNLTLVIPEHHRSSSRSSALSVRAISPRASGDLRRGTFLYREEQRVSLRAFLRTILQNKRVAESKAMEEFLTARPITLNEEELLDIERRKSADAARIEEQEKFYEIARQRAAELDVYMEKFRRSIVEQSKFDDSRHADSKLMLPDGLTKLFAEIKEKNTIQELSPEYQKFAEWLRIEYVSTSTTE
jgi:hypothetical protein